MSLPEEAQAALLHAQSLVMFSGPEIAQSDTLRIHQFLLFGVSRRAHARPNRQFFSPIRTAPRQQLISRAASIHGIVIEILPNGGLPANHLLAPVAVPIRNQVAQRIFDDSDDDSNSESAPSPSSALQYYSSDDNGLSASLVLFSTILCSAVQLVAVATLSAFISASYIFVRHVALMKLSTLAALAASRLREFREVLFDMFQMASLALAYYA